jgi:hypothetical protein
MWISHVHIMTFSHGRVTNPEDRRRVHQGTPLSDPQSFMYRGAVSNILNIIKLPRVIKVLLLPRPEGSSLHMAVRGDGTHHHRNCLVLLRLARAPQSDSTLNAENGWRIEFTFSSPPLDPAWHALFGTDGIAAHVFHAAPSLL